MPCTEEQLVRDAQGGSEDAFSALVQQHGSALYRFLHRRTGSATEAEDLTQEAFVKAYLGLGRFDPEKPFAPWLFTIARNLAASRHRRVRPAIEPERDMDEQTPANVLAEAEAGRRLWAWARDSLPEAQFTALWLRVEEEMDVAGIAERMGKSPANVKVMLHRARKRLADTYRKSGDPVTRVGIAAEAST
jgi:RNA polymerase sigma-70 factor (ECF subfamily)